MRNSLCGSREGLSRLWCLGSESLPGLSLKPFPLPRNQIFFRLCKVTWWGLSQAHSRKAIFAVFLLSDLGRSRPPCIENMAKYGRGCNWMPQGRFFIAGRGRLWDSIPVDKRQREKWWMDIEFFVLIFLRVRLWRCWCGRLAISCQVGWIVGGNCLNGLTLFGPFYGDMVTWWHGELLVWGHLPLQVL